MFDRVNLLAVADRYPHLSRRVILLGDLVGAGEIDDPVDGDAATVAATYAVIRRGVDQLRRLLIDST